MIDNILVVLLFVIASTCIATNDVVVPVKMEFEETRSCRHGLVHGKDSVLVKGWFDTSNVDQNVRDDLGFEFVVVKMETPSKVLTIPWKLSSKVIPIGPIRFKNEGCPPYSSVDVGTCVCSNNTDIVYQMMCNVTVVCRFSCKLVIGRVHINGKTFTDTAMTPVNLSKVVGYCEGSSDQLRSCYEDKERRVVTLPLLPHNSTPYCPTNLIDGVHSVNVTGIILSYGLTYGRDTKVAIRRENETAEPDELETILQDFSVNGCRNVTTLKKDTCACLGVREIEGTLELNVTCNMAAVTILSKQLIHISLWHNHTLYSSEGVRMPVISHRCEYIPDYLPVNITIDTQDVDPKEPNCTKTFTANVWHQFVFRVQFLLPPLFLAIERRGQVLVNATSECVHVIDVIAQGQTVYTFSYGSSHRRFGSHKCLIVGIDTSTSSSLWDSNITVENIEKTTKFKKNIADPKPLYLLLLLPLVMMVFVSLILFLVNGLRFCFTKALDSKVVLRASSREGSKGIAGTFISTDRPMPFVYVVNGIIEIGSSNRCCSMTDTQREIRQ